MSPRHQAQGQRVLSEATISVGSFPESTYHSPILSLGAKDHACLRARNGKVKCWGSHVYKQNAQSLTTIFPLNVPDIGGGAGSTLSDILQVGAGSLSSCALSKIGAVSCWGSDFYGSFGSGTSTQISSYAPVASTLITGAVSVATGGVDDDD